MSRRLLELWDTQQSAYVAHREQRFGVMLEVVRLAVGDDIRVLDLACGPGAISARVVSAFPRASVVGVDYDPILLGVARAAVPSARFVDADLSSPTWTDGIGTVDAVLSSTALHWLSPGELLAVYQAAAGLLRPGGVLLNADHLRYASAGFRSLAEQHDAATQRDGFAAGALEYDAWYAEALREPALAAVAPERERRFADRPPQAEASLEFHLAALRTAGFAEVGTVWQYLDDYVVCARR